MSLRETAKCMVVGLAGLLLGVWVATGFAVHGRAGFAVEVGVTLAVAIVYAVASDV